MGYRLYMQFVLEIFTSNSIYVCFRFQAAIETPYTDIWPKAELAEKAYKTNF